MHFVFYFGRFVGMAARTLMSSNEWVLSEQVVRGFIEASVVHSCTK